MGTVASQKSSRLTTICILCCAFLLATSVSAQRRRGRSTPTPTPTPDATPTPTPSPDGVSLPGTIQAEDYTAMSGIQLETTTDTGGGYYTAETADRFPESMPLEWSRKVSLSETELWNSPWLLLAFVGLISAEWALRRFKGLP